jgi:hypothetical protein
VPKNEPTDSGAWINLIGHGILASLIFYSTVWIAPLFLHIVGLSGYFPSPLLLAMDISNFSNRYGLPLILAIAFLLWLDTAFFKFLLRTWGQVAAVLWSGAITLLLAGALIFFLYLLTIPTTMMYQVRQKIKVEHLPFYYWPNEDNWP